MQSILFEDGIAGRFEQNEAPSVFARRKVTAPKAGTPPLYKPVVHIIDDDVALREGLTGFLEAAKLSVVSFSSPQAFMDSWTASDQGCVILDMRFPSGSGLDFQFQLQELEMLMPVILMTGYADVASSVRAMKAGAIDFLTKPLDDQALLAAIATGFDRDAGRVQDESRSSRLIDQYATLTNREKEVFALVTKGLMNKQVAGELSLSEITVKVHRGTMMRKMKVKTLADLVRAAEKLSADPSNVTRKYFDRTASKSASDFQTYPDGA
jgi:FixJ family two-component response regulator